jgi:hypothetical protein
MTSKFALSSGDSFQFAFGFDVTPTAVPEPASVVLLGSGLVALAFRRRRARKGADDFQPRSL